MRQDFVYGGGEIAATVRVSISKAITESIFRPSYAYKYLYHPCYDILYSIRTSNFFRSPSLLSTIIIKFMSSV